MHEIIIGVNARQRNFFRKINVFEVKKNLFKAIAVPVLTHGFYDFAIDISSVSSVFLLIFLAFEVAVTVIAFRTVNKLAKEDEPLDYYSPDDTNMMM